MVNDVREASRNYPIPDEANQVSEDFPRLRTAFQMIGTDVAAVLAALTGKASATHTHEISAITGLQTALDGKMSASATFSLGSLTDVSVSSASDYMVLTKIGTQWVPWAVDLAHVSGTGILRTDTPQTLSSGAKAQARANMGLATVAGSGAYADLSGLPAIQAPLGFMPVQQGGGTGQGTSKVYIGWLGTGLGLHVDSTNFGATWPISISGNAASANSVAWGGVSGKPTWANVAFSGSWNDLGGKPTWASVAWSGAYGDLSGRPYLGTAAGGNVGTGANNIVVLNGDASLPSLDGHNLFNLPAVSKDNGPFAVGSLAMLQNASGSTIAVGSAVAGGGLVPYYVTTSGVFSLIGGSVGGTWRNWSGTDLVNGYGGLFQRIA